MTTSANIKYLHNERGKQLHFNMLKPHNVAYLSMNLDARIGISFHMQKATSDSKLGSMQTIIKMIFKKLNSKINPFLF